VGDNAYNMKLSQARADAVRKYLITHGIAAPRLVAKGYGPTQPIVPNTSDANRGLNRRVQFIRTESRTP
jgi:outer membrane protein OmpA-like peptidoglycan-associated protein